MVKKTQNISINIDDITSRSFDETRYLEKTSNKSSSSEKHSTDLVVSLGLQWVYANITNES